MSTSTGIKQWCTAQAISTIDITAFKAQLISECLFDFFLIFQKTNKNFDKFLPQNLKSGQIIN